MKEIIGTSNRVLEVDLTNKTFNVYNVSGKELKMYLGGKGLGLKLIYDRIVPGTDPLGKNNIIAFMTGVLMSTGALCSGRFAAVTKSPLTGIMAHSICGGPFGNALKTSGWDGLLVKGASKNPVYLVVDSEGVEFKDAKKIWKKKTSEAQAILDEEGSAIVIGPAGENLVRYANIASGSRFLGRAGMGAVMGSKKLKAVVAKGKEYKIIPKKQAKFKKTRESGLKRINNYHVTAIELRKYGTAGLVNHSNRAGILPVRNFKVGVSDNAYKITGENIASSYNTKHHTCKPCSILCGHKGNFDGKELPVPEYETLGLLGSNLDIYDPVKIAEWNKLCGELGMDTMSTGGVLAWVMEATEKKLVKSALKFGSPNGVSKAIQDISACKGGLSKDMALGIKALSMKYGGEEFAMHIKGLEMAAYDPRGSYGLGLGYAVANRGACHLSSTLMALEVFTGYLLPYTIKPKHFWVKAQEDLYCVLNSIQICLFTTYGFIFESPMIKYSAWFNVKWIMEYLPQIAIKMTDISIYRKFWTSITGINISRKNFLKAGERIHVLERYMNTLEGISRKDDTLPPRMLDEGRECDPKGRTVPLESMLDNYYKIRGYDENGIPSDELLKKLEIEKKSPPKSSVD